MAHGVRKGVFQNIDKILSRVSGKCISGLEVRDNRRLAIHFGDASTLIVEWLDGRLAIDLGAEVGSHKCRAAVWPTSRQREYLEFIRKYLLRFGISPAESDIQRHFLVSAPSVNQMVQTLERHGFITRQRGMPRSIRLVDTAACALCGGSHHLKGKSVRTRECDATDLRQRGEGDSRPRKSIGGSERPQPRLWPADE